MNELDYDYDYYYYYYYYCYYYYYYYYPVARQFARTLTAEAVLGISSNVCFHLVSSDVY